MYLYKLPYCILLLLYAVDLCRKHQVFESATLAATNPPAKEQAASRKQPLRTVVVSSATDSEPCHESVCQRGRLLLIHGSNPLRDFGCRHK